MNIYTNNSFSGEQVSAAVVRAATAQEAADKLNIWLEHYGRGRSVKASDMSEFSAELEIVILNDTAYEE